jgi:hypothetical protein
MQYPDAWNVVVDGAVKALPVRPQLAANTAGSGRGPWYLARAKALSVGASNAYFRSDFLHCSKTPCLTSRTSVYGPFAGWCGRGRQATAAPMPIKSASDYLVASARPNG